MPRKKLIRSSDLPYHVYNRSIDKHFYPIDMKDIYVECCNLLRILTWVYGVKIHAFVLMSNHYHLLISTPEQNLDSAIRYFQTELSKFLTDNTQLQKFRFSGPYRWSLISSIYYFVRVYCYVYQNPVRAGIAPAPELYDYSSLAGRAGREVDFPPIADQCLFQESIPFDFDDELLLIAEMMSEEERERLRKGLNLTKFKIPLRERYPVPV